MLDGLSYRMETPEERPRTLRWVSRNYPPIRTTGKASATLLPSVRAQLLLLVPRRREVRSQRIMGKIWLKTLNSGEIHEPAELGSSVDPQKDKPKKHKLRHIKIQALETQDKGKGRQWLEWICGSDDHHLLTRSRGGQRRGTAPSKCQPGIPDPVSNVTRGRKDKDTLR